MNDDYVDECKLSSSKLGGRTTKTTTRDPCYPKLVENLLLPLINPSLQIRIRPKVSLSTYRKQSEFHKNSPQLFLNSTKSLYFLQPRSKVPQNRRIQTMILTLISSMTRSQFKRKLLLPWNRTQIVPKRMNLISRLLETDRNSPRMKMCSKIHKQKVTKTNFLQPIRNLCLSKILRMMTYRSSRRNLGNQSFLRKRRRAMSWWVEGHGKQPLLKQQWT